MYSMKQRTTIQIEYTTLEKLKEIKIAKRESYDEIVNRLIVINRLHEIKQSSLKIGYLKKKGDTNEEQNIYKPEE